MNGLVLCNKIDFFTLIYKEKSVKSEMKTQLIYKKFYEIIPVLHNNQEMYGEYLSRDKNDENLYYFKITLFIQFSQNGDYFSTREEIRGFSSLKYRFC